MSVRESWEKLPVRRLQVGLRPLQRRDVPRDSPDSDDPTLLVAQGEFRGRDPVEAPVRPGLLLHDLDHRLAGLDDPPFVAKRRDRVLAGEMVEIRGTNDLLHVRRAEPQRLRPAYEEEPRLTVLEVNHVPAQVHDDVQHVCLGKKPHRPRHALQRRDAPRPEFQDPPSSSRVKFQDVPCFILHQPACSVPVRIASLPLSAGAPRSMPRASPVASHRGPKCGHSMAQPSRCGRARPRVRCEGRAIVNAS